MDNDVYNVTPPSLFLNENGPSVYLIGFDEDQVSEISKAFERLYPTCITFFHSNKPIDDSSISWSRAVIGIAETVIVNVDNVNGLELFTVLKGTEHDDELVYWINTSSSPNPLRALINSFKHMKIFNSIDQFIQIVLD